MKKLKFWWHYIKSPSFRGYVHMHDIQSYHDDIKRRREEMLAYESRSMYKKLTNR